MIPIGYQIYLARTARDLTQDRLAALAGIPQANLSNIEKGKQDLTVTTLRRIAQALNLPPAEFFREEPRGERPLKLTRPRIERLAKAIVKGNVRLNRQEKKTADWFREILPGMGTRKSKIKSMHRSWLELKKRFSSSEITVLCERVREMKEKAV